MRTLSAKKSAPVATTAITAESVRCPFCHKLTFNFPYIDKAGHPATMSKCYNETCTKAFRRQRSELLTREQNRKARKQSRKRGRKVRG